MRGWAAKLWHDGRNVKMLRITMSGQEERESEREWQNKGRKSGQAKKLNTSNGHRMCTV